MNSLVRLTCLASSLVLPIFSAAWAAESSTSKSTAAQIEAAVRAADDACLAGVARKSVDAVVAIFAPDAMTTGSAVFPARTPGEFRTGWAAILADPNGSLAWTVDTVVVPESGILAAAMGTWHNAGDSGPFLDVWQPEGGDWKVIISSSWRKPLNAPLATSPSVTDPGEQAVRAADETLSKAVTAKSIEQMVPMYEAEAVTAGTMMTPCRGLEALRAEWVKGFADPGFSMSWTCDAAGVFPNRNLAFTSGNWTSGEKTGPYLTVWRKQADGSWKVLVDAAW